MIVDMKSNINLKPISTDISAVAISKFYFTVPKIIRLNATHFYWVDSQQKLTSANSIKLLMKCSV